MKVPRKCFLLGAGGMGMAPLAIYLQKAGVLVEAFDDSFREPVRSLLERCGVRILSEPVPSFRPDVVVRSSAICESLPSLDQWKEQGIPVLRRGDFLAKLTAECKVLAVVGSHGKTTTTAMIAWLLRKLGFPCGYIIGGLFRNREIPPGMYSDSPWIVIEVDESDGTIDGFSPTVTLCLNCDWDHSSQYSSLQEFCETLGGLFSRTESSVIVPEGDDLFKLAQSSATCPTITFENSLEPGAYNSRNEAAAITVCRYLGLNASSDDLTDFPGLARRQVVLYESPDRYVLEDYAHHPTEIRAVLAQAENNFPERRLKVVFQPHRYSRTRDLVAEFAEELSATDDLFLLPTYSAFESPDVDGSVENMMGHLPPRLRKTARVYTCLSDLSDAIGTSPLSGDQVLFLGAGDLDRYAHAFSSLQRSKGDDWLAWFDYLQTRLSKDCILRMDEPLADKTTLRVGGSSTAYAEPSCAEDLRELVDACSLFNFPFFVMGRGSNLIVPDDGFAGLALRLVGTAWKEVRLVLDDTFVVKAGTRLKEICRLACEQGLAGFEFLEGIPGTLGGALRMNAGAMGGEIFDLVETVTFLMPNGRVREIAGENLTVGYRVCAEADEGIVLRARLRATGFSSKIEVRRQIDKFSNKRWASQPRESSAGCIFRNPTDDSAGRLIDHHGLKGESLGAASISNVHANFIVNQGGATADEVISLIRRVRGKVKDSTGVELQPEVTLLGKSWEEALN
ncbi:MAG: UDP-N-acetylenolpyruvoylglucosamine reductase [Opitutae bacterium]|nr:UDP-N-acetylenolpyruvoylglucosamine reductase [Opitutae bacterium]